MKIIVLIASISFMASICFGATNVSVVIDGQTYVCSGTGAATDCSGKVAGFQATLNACMQSSSGSYCEATYWPQYKSSNPNCVSDGIPACLAACMKNSSGSYCAAVCQ